MRTNILADMKKVVSMILALALSLCFTIASAEDSELLGKPFPGFTATDTEGNTLTLSKIPRDASTLAFPVSADRAIHVENEDAKCVLFRQEGNPIPRRVYVIHDDVAHLRLEITAEDDPTVVTYYNLSDIEILQSLLDPERNAYVIDQPMPDPDTGDYYIFGALVPEDNDLTKAPSVYLIPDEEYIERLAEDLRSRGYDVTWEYGDYIPPEQPRIQSYLLHIVDQNGDPVPGVMVNFCTDTTCSPTQSDENGIISFGGAPDVYHIQLLKAPEGYSFDADFELYTEAEYGEWLLRIRKES